MGLFDFLRSKPAPPPTAEQVAAIVLPQVVRIVESLVVSRIRLEVDVAIGQASMLDTVTEAELANALRDAEPNDKVQALVQQAFDQVGRGTAAEWDGKLRDASGAVVVAVEVDATARHVWLAIAPGWATGLGKHSDGDTVAPPPEINPPATKPETRGEP